MQNPFPVHHSPHACNKKWNIPICVTFTCNWLDWTGLGLGLVVFGLSLKTDLWSRSRSRSRTLWSRSWPWSHYVLVSLTSLAMVVVGSRKVVVYGSNVDVYCCVQSLLQTGLPGKQIVIVEPPQPSQVTFLFTCYCFDLLYLDTECCWGISKCH